VDPLTRTLLAALDPLLDAAADPGQLRSLLFQLGVELEDTSLLRADGPLAEVLEPVGALAAGVDELRSDLDGPLDLRDAIALGAAVPGLVGDVLAAAGALERAPELMTGADVPDELRDPALWASALERLPGVLVAQALQQETPGLYLILRALGVVAVDSTAPAGELRLSALAGAAADPTAALASALGWGQGDVDADALGELLFAAADAAGLPLSAGAAGGAPGSPMTYELPLASGDLPGLGFVESGLAIEPVAGAGGASAGLAVVPYALGAPPTRIELAGGAFVELSASDGEPTRLILEPGRAPRLEGPSPRFEVAFGATFTPPALVLGFPGLGVTASAFQLTARFAGGAIEVDLDASPGLTAGFGGAGDGFLQSLLGGLTSITFDPGLTWRQGGELRFRAGVGLTVRLPDITFGPVTLDEIELTLLLGDPIAGTLTARVGAAVGPLAFSVGGIGLAFELVSVEGAPLCPSVRFVPPTRVTITVTSDAVNGGGFLDIDPETGRYVGGLALDIFGLGLSAIVIVDTELPGGEEGWALFGSLGLEFLTPIPIGFGFTLLGVGGLLALHRTMDVDALAMGLRTGAADAILFPDDLENDADEVAAGLDQWFPVLDGSTVFGPVVLIGWGSPTLITAQLGVVIALPDLIIAVLGSVEVLLPTPDDAVLSLRMDVLGAIDLPASEFIVAASLHDSNLLGIFELSGDMGFYLRLSGQPVFLLSVGGYHPQFDPPGALPAWLLELRRTSASVDLGEGVDIVLTSYVAVTSNTLQFGGRFRLEASVEVLLTTYTAEGWFGINVLLVLKPFKLVCSASAGVSISAGDRELLGVTLRARLEGPEPWFATGRASFRFFGVDVEFGFDIGSRPGGEPREIHDVAGDVVLALEGAEAWEPIELEDTWGRGVVTDGELPAGLWVRPDQAIQARQSVAPLNRTITAFGELVPEDERIDATNVTLGGAPVATPEWLDDWFAPAQFDRLDDTTRLSSPSYELMTAGVRFGADGVGISADPDRECTSVSRAPEDSLFPRMARPRPVYVSPARPAASPTARRTVAGTRIAVLPTTYTVVRARDGLPASDVLAEAAAASGLAYAEAVSVLAGRTAQERARLRVAPAHAAAMEAA
jgi:hypothetical protein